MPKKIVRYLSKFFLLAVSMVFVLIINSCAIFSSVALDEIPTEISDFRSDGCSSFPDGRLTTPTDEWLHCCLVHDIYYWMGGSRSERKRADHELNECVSVVSNSSQGEAMELAVRIAGGPLTGLPWRWGYGREVKVPYFYRTASHDEKILEKIYSIDYEVDKRLDSLSLPQINYIKNKLRDIKKNLKSSVQKID